MSRGWRSGGGGGRRWGGWWSAYHGSLRGGKRGLNIISWNEFRWRVSDWKRFKEW
jgi:hypothetical protein